MKRIIITPNEAKVLESKGALKLEDLHELIETDVIDIITRKIGGNVYQIIVDDEGKLKPNQATARALDAEEWLVGNLIVTRYDSDGEEEGLEDEDIVNVWAHIIKTKNPNYAFLNYCCRAGI